MNTGDPLVDRFDTIEDFYDFARWYIKIQDQYFIEWELKLEIRNHWKRLKRKYEM